MELAVVVVVAVWRQPVTCASSRSLLRRKAGSAKSFAVYEPFGADFFRAFSVPSRWRSPAASPQHVRDFLWQKAGGSPCCCTTKHSASWSQSI